MKRIILIAASFLSLTQYHQSHGAFVSNDQDSTLVPGFEAYGDYAKILISLQSGKNTRQYDTPDGYNLFTNGALAPWELSNNIDIGKICLKKLSSVEEISLITKYCNYYQNAMKLRHSSISKFDYANYEQIARETSHKLNCYTSRRNRPCFYDTLLGIQQSLNTTYYLLIQLQQCRIANELICVEHDNKLLMCESLPVAEKDLCFCKMLQQLFASVRDIPYKRAVVDFLLEREATELRRLKKKTRDIQSLIFHETLFNLLDAHETARECLDMSSY